jgi:hypothetical protein
MDSPNPSLVPVKGAGVAAFLKQATSPLLLLVLAGAIYCCADFFVDLPPSGLVFHSETVTANPKGDRIEFECRFVFKANHPRKTHYQVAFPTQEGEDPQSPKDVEVSVDGKRVDVELLSQGFVCDMPVNPGGETIRTIRYSLAARDRNAVYITRTAGLWRKPLGHARFVVPEGVRSNYHKKGQTVAEFTEFRPEENWILSWKDEQ